MRNILTRANPEWRTETGSEESPKLGNLIVKWSGTQGWWESSKGWESQVKTVEEVCKKELEERWTRKRKLLSLLQKAAKMKVRWRKEKKISGKEAN